MNSIAVAPSRPGATTSATTRTGRYSAAPATAESHTNAAPPWAVLASRFQPAWAKAATRTRRRAKPDTQDLLAGDEGPPGFYPFRCGRLGPGAARSRSPKPSLSLAPRARAGAEP